ELARLLVGQAVLRAVVLEESDPSAAEGGLEGARAVVEPGVDDSAVVAGLVRGDPVLLLEDGDAGAGAVEGDVAGQGQSDDPRSDDADVFGAAHGRTLATRGP